MTHYHAIVWLDHSAARVFHFNADEVEKLVIKPDHPTRHIHHKAGSTGGGKAHESQHYYADVTEAIADAGAILVTGPANAKLELIKHIHKHRPGLMERIAGVETSDHPSDGKLVDHARRVFEVHDRTTPQKA